MARTLHFTLAALMGGTALTAGGGAAFAQDNEEAQAQVKDVIIVTGRGREETIVEAPLSQTVFTSEAIVNARIDQVDDFIALTPGLTIANSQDPGTNFITIRGMSQTRNGEPPVAVVIDDVLQVSARSFDQGLFDIESIEVLRGPQGALYGRNATNGAILITTRGPTEEFEGYGQLTIGDGGEYGIEGSVSGPLGGESVLGRISARYTERDGYLDNIVLGDEVDPLEELNLRGQLRFNIADNVTADLQARTTQTDGGALNFTFQGLVTDPETGFVTGFGGPTGADVVEQDFVANNIGVSERDTSQLSLRLNADLGWATLRSVTAYDELESLVAGDQFPYTGNSTANIGLSFFDGTQTQYVDLQALSQEIRLTSLDDQRFRWMVGGYYLKTDRFISTTVGDDVEQGILEVQKDPAFGDPTNPTTSWIADDNENTAWALFFNTAFDIHDNLEIAFAGRYDNDEREQIVDTRQGAYDADGNLLSAIGVPGAVNTAEFNRFQPKVSVRYLASDDLSFYGSWGQGFRSGQFNQNGVGAVAADAGIAGVLDVYDQEDSETFEVGFKSQGLLSGVSASGAVYHTTVDNAPYFVFIGSVGAQVLVGIDEVEIFGGELEASANLMDGLDAYIGLGLSDSEIKAYTLNPDAVGNNAPYAPDMTFNLGAQYRTPITQSLGLFGRVDYERRGEQFWDPENSTARSALDLINVRAGIESTDGAWSLVGSVDNLTDEEYNSEWVLGGFAHAGLPRVWRVDLRYDF